MFVELLQDLTLFCCQVCGNDLMLFIEPMSIRGPSADLLIVLIFAEIFVLELALLWLILCVRTHW